MGENDLSEPYLMTYLVLNFTRPASKHRDLPNKPRMHANCHSVLFGDLRGCLYKKEEFWLVSEARWSAAAWIKFPLAMEFTEIHSTKGNLERLQAGQEPRE